MFCPRCGQQQISEETRFCSRCGFLLTGVSEVILNEGVLPKVSNAPGNAITPRKRGLRKGLFIFLLTFLFVPIVSIITIALKVEPFAVAIATVIFFVGGLLRMAYAMMFESNEPTGNAAEQNALSSPKNLLRKNKTANALPPQDLSSTYIPPVQGNWRETNDLIQPSSVEGTTKLLEGTSKRNND